jgi:hypothetical protein
VRRQVPSNVLVDCVHCCSKLLMLLPCHCCQLLLPAAATAARQVLYQSPDAHCSHASTQTDCDSNCLRTWKYRSTM